MFKLQKKYAMATISRKVADYMCSTAISGCTFSPVYFS